MPLPISVMDSTEYSGFTQVPPRSYEPEPEPEPELEPMEETGHPPHYLSREAVCYRMPEEKCGNCEYMRSSDGFCSFLGQPVHPEAGCNAFEYKSEGGHAAEAGTMAAE